MAEKPLLKKICSILAVFLFILLGFNIFQYQRNRALINKPGSDGNADKETIPASNNESESMYPGEAKRYGDKRISELEEQLHAAEEDLDISTLRLDRELSKKKEYKELLNSTKPFSSPSDQKRLKKSYIETLTEEYDPLFRKMNISKEDYDELIGILADRQVAFVLAVPADLAMASEDQKEEMKNQMQEINQMTANEIKDLLDDDNYQIYTAYKDSISIRKNLNSFMETLLPEERLKEAQTEQLVESMYLAGKTVSDEMGPAEEPESIADIPRILEKQRQVYDNYLEISSNSLTEEQVEKYRIYLEKQLRRYKSQLYITLTK